MEPLSTTTIGEGESATTDMPFHIMNADERIKRKLRSCAAPCRGFWREENMVYRRTRYGSGGLVVVWEA